VWWRISYDSQWVTDIGDSMALHALEKHSPNARRTGAILQDTDRARSLMLGDDRSRVEQPSP
jgi:hypothetical protein